MTDDGHSHGGFTSRELERVTKTLNRDVGRSTRQQEVERAFRDHYPDLSLPDYDLGRVLYELSCECGDNRHEMLREVNSALENLYDAEDRDDEEYSGLSKRTLYNWLKEEPLARYDN